MEGKNVCVKMQSSVRWNEAENAGDLGRGFQLQFMREKFSEQSLNKWEFKGSYLKGIYSSLSLINKVN